MSEAQPVRTMQASTTTPSRLASLMRFKGVIKRIISRRGTRRICYMKDAAHRRFELVLLWSLDRFSREGITKTIAYLQQLDGYGVKFKSLTEPFLDSDNDLVAHILLRVLLYFAQLEATKISGRTRAGLARVRKEGKTLGRPDGFGLYAPQLAKMKAEGYSQGRMSRETGLAINTVKGYLRLV